MEATAAAVVSAVATVAKINSNGPWVGRSEHVSLNELFARMTREEMLKYAEEGTLPTWFERTMVQQLLTVAEDQMYSKPSDRRGVERLQGATVLGPADFPIGSPESRAAARLRLQEIGGTGGPHRYASASQIMSNRFSTRSPRKRSWLK